MNLPALLNRIKEEILVVLPVAQWTMNATPTAIGIAFADLRPRPLTMGEGLGLYRDYPTAKGCISPFAPIWIAEMVRRKVARQD